MSVAKIGTEYVVKVFSKVFNKQEANEMVMTTAQILMQEGEARAGRNMVLAAIRIKFGKIPKKIEKAVLGMSDSIALESLHAQVFHCNTLEEFAAVLK